MSIRLSIAKEDIEKTFSEGPPILDERAMRDILKAHRANWRLSKQETFEVFTSFMLEKTSLRYVHVPLPRRPISGYTWGAVPLMESLLALVPGSYYSHYTAIRLHGLTEQVPKTLYLSKEKRRGHNVARLPKHEAIQQADIDQSFSNPARESSNQVELVEEGMRVMLLDAVDHQGAGIITNTLNLGEKHPLKLRYTSLERTLIDIVIRPSYAGGIFEVAKVFEHALGKLSVNVMQALYKKLNLYYPYHQAIGFYLERAGYRPNLVELFHRMPIERDFYLAHAMGKTHYNKRWRLHVPEGF